LLAEPRNQRYTYEIRCQTLHHLSDVTILQPIPDLLIEIDNQPADLGRCEMGGTGRGWLHDVGWNWKGRKKKKSTDR
jgi:hypothetical protein